MTRKFDLTNLARAYSPVFGLVVTFCMAVVLAGLLTSSGAAQNVNVSTA